MGTVGLITPWNYPLPIPSWKIAPELVAGGIAKENGCATHPRDCINCQVLEECEIKSYTPSRRT